jgi:hypothetical protein
LLFQERRKEGEEKKKKGKMAFQWAGQQLPVCSALASMAVMCYRKLF